MSTERNGGGNETRALGLPELSRYARLIRVAGRLGSVDQAPRLTAGVDLQRMRDDRGNFVSDAGQPTSTVILDQREQATSAYVRLKVEPQDAVGQPMAGFPAWTPLPVATPTS